MPYYDGAGNELVSGDDLTPVIPGQVACVAGDNAVPFGQKVAWARVQNNTGATINVAPDVAATAGSLAVGAGASVDLPLGMSVLHVFVTGAPTVNGATAGGIVVWGGV